MAAAKARGDPAGTEGSEGDGRLSGFFTVFPMVVVSLRWSTYVFNVRPRTVDGRCGPEDCIQILPQALATGWKPDKKTFIFDRGQKPHRRNMETAEELDARC